MQIVSKRLLSLSIAAAQQRGMSKTVYVQVALEVQFRKDGVE
jgi:hypothetical protein